MPKIYTFNNSLQKQLSSNPECLHALTVSSFNSCSRWIWLGWSNAFTCVWPHNFPLALALFCNLGYAFAFASVFTPKLLTFIASTNVWDCFALTFTILVIPFL